MHYTIYIYTYIHIYMYVLSVCSVASSTKNMSQLVGH